MNVLRLAVFAPLALLVACGGTNPNAGSAKLRVDGGAADAKGQLASVQPGSVTEPGRLKGLNPLQVRSVLGKPVFTRRDAPAEIWQYRGRACTLDLFLYDDSGSQKVAHYAVRSSQPVNERECLDDLVAGNQGIPTS